MVGQGLKLCDKMGVRDQKKTARYTDAWKLIPKEARVLQ